MSAGEIVVAADVEDVRRFLSGMESVVRRMTSSDAMLGTESIVLRLGRPWTAAAQPRGMRKQRNGRCYANAFGVLVGTPHLRYVEGYALSPGGLLPVQHGWCVDQEDRVIDPTWKDAERCAYYGVEIPEDLLGCAMFLTRVYGFLGQPRTEKLISRLGRLPTTAELVQAYSPRRA